MTGDDFRELALGMRQAVEGAHMGHPDFRAGRRIFASLQADERWAVVKLSPDEQRELLRMHPAMFTPAAGAWGRQGWTKVNLAKADATTVRGALLLAWQGVAERSRSGRSPTRAKAAAPSSRKRRA